MIIVWGTKIVHKKVGRVAEYCGACREPRPFAFEEIRQVGHLYYIPMGSGTVVGHEIMCEQCRLRMPLKPGRFAVVNQERGATLDDLIAQTNPGLYQEMVERLNLQEQIETGKLTREQRRDLMFEPFLAIGPTVEARAKQGHIDWRTGLSLLALVVLPWPFVVVGSDGAGITATLFLWLGILLAVGALGSMIYFGLTSVSGHIRRQHGAGLANGLRPLKPTLAEIEETLAVLGQNGWQVGRKINAKWLHALIERSSRV